MGSTIAFFRGTESHRQLWFVSTGDPASARSSGSPRGLSYGAAWLGDGGPLARRGRLVRFSRAQPLRPGTGKTARGRALAARGFPTSIARGNLVYENAAYQANLFLVDIGDPTGKPQMLWPSTRYTNQPEYRPGRKACGLRLQSRRRAGHLPGCAGRRSRATAIVRRFPVHASALVARRQPDLRRQGRAQAGRRRHRTKPIRIAFPDGSVEVLGNLATSVFDVREADEARSLLVGEHAGNAARLLRVRARRSAPLERLPLPLASEYQVAGDSIAFTQPQLPGITLCSLASLHCEPLAVPVGDESATTGC